MKRIDKKRSRLEPVFPPDMDAMVQVSGIAVVALVACTFDALRIARALPGVALAASVEYVAGLIFIGRRATAARINRILGGVSHDRLTRLREQPLFRRPAREARLHQTRTVDRRRGVPLSRRHVYTA